MSETKNEETGMALVASILAGIQSSQLATERRMGAMEGKLGEIHAEVRKTNGRVTEIETWRDGFQDEAEQAASYAAGRKSVRERDRALLRIGVAWLTKRLPWALALLLGGMGARLAAWYVGGEW